MGFSVTIASSIILIVLLVLSSSFLITIFQGLKEISYAAKEYLNSEKEKLDVSLQLAVNSVNATSCNVTVKNTGSKTIFLKKQGNFSWNTIILSYGNGSFWFSYSIEDYEILEIKVSGTNYTFSQDNHTFINSGEEVTISFSIPNGAPEIPLDGLVSVVFVTHYGVEAKAEGVRTQ
jgi:archaellum component FlaF (FlaF/FlaG flagellin family)